MQNLLLQTTPRQRRNQGLRAHPFQRADRFHANSLWVPDLSELLGMHSRSAKLAFDGWQSAGIVSAKSGAPIAIRNSNSSYPSDRPDRVNGVNLYRGGSRTARQYLNPAAFAAVPTSPLSLAQERGGDLRRDDVRIRVILTSTPPLEETPILQSRLRSGSRQTPSTLLITRTTVACREVSLRRSLVNSSLQQHELYSSQGA